MQKKKEERITQNGFFIASRRGTTTINRSLCFRHRKGGGGWSIGQRAKSDRAKYSRIRIGRKMAPKNELGHVCVISTLPPVGRKSGVVT